MTREERAGLLDDAEALERAAGVIRYRSDKPDAVLTQALIKVLENSAASMRKRASR